MAIAKLNGEPEPAGRAALRERVTQLFLYLLRQIHTGPAGPWLGLQLTMPQLKMLFVVDWLGPAPMSRVAERLHISDSAATGLIERLVEQGLARREPDPRDRRIVRVVSTSEGQALVEQLRSVRRERVGRLLERLSTEELRSCATAMELVNRAAEAEFQPGPAALHEEGVQVIAEAGR